MLKLYRTICCVLGAGVMASCASEAPRTAPQANGVVESRVREETSPAERTALGRPVIRAEVLSVQQGTTAELVKGTLYVTRRGEGMSLKASQAIEQDDLLQLSADAAVRLRAPDGAEFDLTAQHGEWFRFDVTKK